MDIETGFENLGQRLKTRRTEKGLTVEEVSEATRIPVHQLASLESGQFDNLPALVYVRGFIRAYARLLAMDERELLDEFNTLADQKQRNEVAGLIDEYEGLPTQKAMRLKTVISSAEPKKRKFIISPLIGGLIIVLALILGFYYFFSLRDGGPEGELSGTVITPSAETISEQTTQPSPQSESRPEPQVQPDDSQKELPSEEDSSLAEPRKEEPSAEAEITVRPQPEEKVAESPFPPSPAITTAMGAHTLEMVALEETWVRVLIDGRVTREYLLSPGMSVSLTAEEDFKLLVGNAGGLQLSLNGRVLPRLGGSGEVRIVTLPNS